MIVVDTSAIIAIFEKEPEAVAMATCIATAHDISISAATLLEATMVLSGRHPSAPTSSEQWLDNFLSDVGAVIEPGSIEQAQIARLAFRRFGKGTGHGAGLNFGDCFAYALAKSLDVPLLFKGNDFSRTDIVSALA